MNHETDGIWAGAPTVQGVVNYVGEMNVRPQFFARDYSRDNLVIDSVTMPVHDLRSRREDVSLDAEGFRLVDHETRVSDFRDEEQIKTTYLSEIRELIACVSGANKVLVSPSAILRFGERSDDYRKSFNSRPARFVHVDLTPKSAPVLLKSRIGGESVAWPPAQRIVGYNVWRVLSAPPQDVPLAVCDIRSLEEGDRVPADAMFDPEEGAGFTFEAFLLKHNPHHRWAYFSGMTQAEALVFKNFDTEADHGGGIPHVAFDDPTCPGDVAPRASIEARAFAVFD